MIGLWFLEATVPPYALLRCTSCSLQSGLETGVCAPRTDQIKNCRVPLAPVETLPCSNEVSRTFGKAHKRKKRRHLLFCRALCSKTKPIVFLWKRMACGSWWFAVPPYALLRCTSCSLQSGLGTKVGAPCNPTNEMLSWPTSPG